MREIIKKLEERIDLDNQIMIDAVNQIMSGKVEDPMIEDFLIKLNKKIFNHGILDFATHDLIYSINHNLIIKINALFKFFYNFSH